MIERLLLSLIIVFFILAFAVKNIKTYLSTGNSIRGKSLKLTLSILLSSMIYVLLLLRLILDEAKWFVELDLLQDPIIRYVGYGLVFIGFILGILALVAMRNSWRVGIKYDQKTELVTTGIYRISRNPYFLSYDLLITGYVLLFPSILLIILLIALGIIFHRMILEEEQYLVKTHGESYLEYKNRVNRYITLN